MIISEVKFIVTIIANMRNICFAFAFKLESMSWQIREHVLALMQFLVSAAQLKEINPNKNFK
jgi:hypothetical protein